MSLQKQRLVALLMLHFLRLQVIYPIDNVETQNIALSQLNINSSRNKFVPVTELIKTELDIFLDSEIKIDQISNSAFFNQWV